MSDGDEPSGNLGKIEYGTKIKFNDTLTLPTNFTEIAIEATSDYSTVPYISKIKFNGTSMSYNDGNTDYAVYSNGKWASADAKNIIIVENYAIESRVIKDWFVANSSLAENEDGDLYSPNTIPSGTVIKFNDTLNVPSLLGEKEQITGSIKERNSAIQGFVIQNNSVYFYRYANNNYPMFRYISSWQYISSSSALAETLETLTFTLTADWTTSYLDWLIANTDLTKDKLIYKEV